MPKEETPKMDPKQNFRANCRLSMQRLHFTKGSHAHLP